MFIVLIDTVNFQPSAFFGLSAVAKSVLTNKKINKNRTMQTSVNYNRLVKPVYTEEFQNTRFDGLTNMTHHILNFFQQDCNAGIGLTIGYFWEDHWLI